MHKEKRKGINNAIILEAWCIWRQRNRTVFEGDLPAVSKVQQSFLEELTCLVLTGAHHLSILGIIDTLRVDLVTRIPGGLEGTEREIN